MPTDLKPLLDKINVDADWIGLRNVEETITYRIARDARPERNEIFSTKGLFIEVMKDGFIGYAATNNLSTECIRDTAKKALQQATQMKEWGLTPVTLDQRPGEVGGYETHSDKNFNALSTKDQTDLLIECCQKLKAGDKIVSTNANLMHTAFTTSYVSTNGADFTQNFSYVTPDLVAVAQDAGISQRRSDGGFGARSLQGGAELLNPQLMFERAGVIGEEALELLSAEDCPTGKTTVVIHPDQMSLQIHESIGHPLEIDRILGDERNYAGSSFVSLKDFGELQYGSELLNVTYDPTLKGEFASFAFDDGGLKATREFLIKEGKLLRGLGGAESALRSGQKPVANFRSMSWNRPAIDRIGNVNVEAGDKSFDEIISNIEDGIYMMSNRSWSIDDYRRKFQFGCEYAKKIENGKLTKTLKNPNYRGETISFWSGLSAVGDESTFEVYGSPYCGKGEPNQVIRVGHASPVCAFEGLEAFGGAQ